MKRRQMLIIGASFAALAVAVYVGIWTKQPQSVKALSEALPATQQVTGIVRDFLPTHPDFNVTPSNGYGHYCGNIETELDAQDKPVFKGGGFRVAKEWRDSQARQICWHLFSLAWDDHEGKGQKGSVDPGAISSEQSFAQWFRDVPGVNMSWPHTLVLTQVGGGMYEYLTNDFHPIDNMLLGNDSDDGKNLHFTFELIASFVYHPEDNPVLEFTGDDDIWVFINKEMVVDLGGIAGNGTQFVNLKRLGLTAGETYPLHFFHAERKQPKSQFRFRTNLILNSGTVVPTINGSYD